jgi:hypothetical protein
MTGGDGGGRGKLLETDTVQILKEKARKYNIPGRSKMKKAQLVKAIRDKQAEIGQRLRLRK